MIRQTFSIKKNGVKALTPSFFRYSRDIMDVAGQAIVKMKYSEKSWKFWEPKKDTTENKERVEITSTSNSHSGRIFYGEIIRRQRIGEYIHVDIRDMGYKFKVDTGSATSTPTTIQTATGTANANGVTVGVQTTVPNTTPPTPTTATTIGSTLKELIETCDFTANLKGISKAIYDKPYTPSSTTETPMTAGTTTPASTTGITSGNATATNNFKPSCNYCTKSGVPYKWYTTTAKNECPFCGTPTLIYNPKGVPEGEWTCSKCRADFCGTCGRDKMVPPRKVLTMISSPAQGNAGDAAGAGTMPTEASTPISYEDQINQICAENNLYMYIDQYMNCYVNEFKGTQSPAYKIPRTWGIRPTYTYVDGEAKGYNAVTVTYKNGKVTKAMDGITTSEINAYKTNQQSMDRKAAEEEAKKLLYQMEREREVETYLSFPTMPEVYPGRWIQVPHLGKKDETLYCCSINYEAEGWEGLLSYGIFKKAPPIPEYASQSATGTGNLSSLDAIGQQAATFVWFSQSDALILQQTGKGDCYAMSYWLYDKITKVGIQTRIIQYHSDNSKSGTHRTAQIFVNNTWQHFPYTKYGKFDGFGVISKYCNNFKLINPTAGRRGFV